MQTEIYFHREGTEIQVAYIEDDKLMEFFVEEPSTLSILGNIYKAKVVDVLPGMNAAFVDIGLMKNAFLFINDVLHLYTDTYIEHSEEITTADDNNPPMPDTPVPMIDDYIKRNEEILVQVSKDVKGGKNVRVSMKITIPGKYLVYLPTLKHIGISHRITDEKIREDILGFVTEHTPAGAGFIIRTRACEPPKEYLLEEMQELIRRWEVIKEKSCHGSAPQLIHTDIGIVGKTLRDLVDDNVVCIRVDDRSLYNDMKDMLIKEWPERAACIECMADGKSSFEDKNIDAQLHRALNRKVSLKNGGYIVVDQTEALTTIDVNTGSFIGVSNPEETAFETNIEAAITSIQQIRLRNLSGMIIIDFIDMKEPVHRNKIIECIQDGIKKDRVRMNLVQMSELGLIELTRKRIRKPLQSYYLEECPTCRGQGVVPSTKLLRSDILKKLKKEYKQNWKKITLQLHPRVAEALRNDDSFFDAITYQYGLKMEIESIMDVSVDTIKILPE